MDAHHASLGRKKLEEIRQKKAAQKLLPGSLKGSSSTGTLNAIDGSAHFVLNQPTEKDYQDLLSYAMKLEANLRELKEQNQGLSTKVEMLEMERTTYEKKLQTIEENELPSLRRALKDASMEKDAAVTSKEDLASHVRSLKRHLREVEEEQYKAEEHASALQAELDLMQRQQVQHQNSAMPLFSINSEEHRIMQQEMASLKIQLQEVLQQMHDGQMKLTAEKDQCESLMAEKQQLEENLSILSSKNSELVAKLAAMDTTLVDEKKKVNIENNQEKLHELALMVERLERGRQKLLTEIDAQSLEIEKLFIENTSLSAVLQDTRNIAAEWEDQVQKCLKQNADLQATLGKLQTEYDTKISDTFMQINNSELRKEFSENQVSSTENLKLQAELIQSQAKVETLSAEVTKLSVELKRTIHAYNSVTSLYEPILRNIEGRLMQTKQDNFAEVTL